MTRIYFLVPYAAFALFVLVSCGVSGSSGSSSGVSPEKGLRNLSTSEIADVCDWTINILERKSASCINAEASQEAIVEGIQSCIGSFATLPETCNTTVRSTERCINALDGLPCGGSQDEAFNQLGGACTELISCGVINLE